MCLMTSMYTWLMTMNTVFPLPAIVVSCHETVIRAGDVWVLIQSFVRSGHVRSCRMLIQCSAGEAQMTGQ